MENVPRSDEVITVELIATCPSCHTYIAFQYLGEQHWPEDVAAAAGIETVVHMWRCTHCHTTMTETELE